jgi:hypothetical protein
MLLKAVVGKRIELLRFVSSCSIDFIASVIEISKIFPFFY